MSTLNNGVVIPESTIALAKQAMGVVDQKVRNLVNNHPDYFPLYTEKGKWKR
jgi:hypothetical protein